jgi:hypothetical protein
MPGRHDERASRVWKRSAAYLKEVKALGDRVRALREKQGLILEEAAWRCGQMGWKDLQEIEKGKRNVQLVNLVRLAHGLGMGSVAALLGCEPAAEKRRRPRRRS